MPALFSWRCIHRPVLYDKNVKKGLKLQRIVNAGKTAEWEMKPREYGPGLFLFKKIKLFRQLR